MAVGFCEGILEGKKSMVRGVDWTALWTDRESLGIGLGMQRGCAETSQSSALDEL